MPVEYEVVATIEPAAAPYRVRCLRPGCWLNESPEGKPGEHSARAGAEAHASLFLHATVAERAR